MVDGDGKLEELRPARTVVVVENKAAVVHNTRFTTTLDDTVLRHRKWEGHSKEIERGREREGKNKRKIDK